jgi:hypothetical protein
MPLFKSTGRFFSRILGLHGNADVRGTGTSRDFASTCARVENSIRGLFAWDPSRVLRVDRYRGFTVFHAYRGNTAGMTVSLLLKSSDEERQQVQVALSRSSRFEEWVLKSAIAGALVAMLAVPVIIVARGWVLPPLILGATGLLSAIVVGIFLTRLTAPVVALVERGGHGLFTDREGAAIRAAVEAAMDDGIGWSEETLTTVTAANRDSERLPRNPANRESFSLAGGVGSEYAREDERGDTDSGSGRAR